MKITDITLQVNDKNRVSISVDGKYRFSLDVFQVGELGLKIGKEYSEDELIELETESTYGRLYARALEYCLMRPHSAKEVRDYLWRKTLTRRTKNRHTGEVVERAGVSKSITDRVFDRLVDKGYINDESFARYWVENRSVSKGVSRRKLTAELRAKGVDSAIIEKMLSETSRDERVDLRKVIEKRQKRYNDEQKFIAYLLRQGFTYDSIREELSRDS